MFLQQDPYSLVSLILRLTFGAAKFQFHQRHPSKMAILLTDENDDGRTNPEIHHAPAKRNHASWASLPTKLKLQSLEYLLQLNEPILCHMPWLVCDEIFTSLQIPSERMSSLTKSAIRAKPAYANFMNLTET